MPSPLDFSQLEYIPPQNVSELLNTITRALGILSIAGCIFNIVVTTCLGKSKFIIGKMVVLIAVFDILTHTPLVLSTFRLTSNRLNCEVIGSWILYFGYAGTLFFTTSFAHALYHSLKNGSIECVEKYFKKYIAISLAAALMMGSLSLVFRFRQYIEFENGQSLCVTRHNEGIDWGSLLILFIPGVINIVGCIFYYIRVIRLLNSLDQKLHWGPLVYPLILVICISPAMIRRFFYLIGIEINNALYAEITRGLFGAQGLLNSLAYGLSREIYHALRRCCCLPPQKKSEGSIKLLVSGSESHFGSSQQEDLKTSSKLEEIF